MKKIYTAFLFTILVTFFGLATAQAQCPGCTIDPSCGVGINPIEPTLCPEVLPNGVQGEPYDQNITFFMPRDFTDSGSGADVTLNTIIVTSITGMPGGMNHECNQPNCSYTITSDINTQRGCVKICGIPSAPGNYNVVVSVVANVSTPIGTINQPTGFTLPLTIDPAPGGNCCFSFDPPSACGNLDVTYEALLNFEPLQPTEYSWDFDNDNVSTDAEPPVQSYSTPGDYYPELTTTVYNYVVSEVSFTAAGSNWCGDVEEASVFGACQGDPDMYLTFSNGGQTFESSVTSNNLNSTWSNLGLVLENNSFSLQFWDSDNISTDDNLGVYSLNVTGTGTFNFSTFVSGNQEGFGTVTVITVVDQEFVTEDTVSVFPIPATPEITFSPAQNVCSGDSVLLSAPQGPYQYQWLEAGSFISDSIATWVSVTEYYSLLIIDTTFYCQALSDSFLVQVLPNLSPPVITYNANTGNLEIVNNGGYNVEWFNNGISVAGETGNALSLLNGSGPYTVSLTNIAGCSENSIEFWLCIPGQVSSLGVDTICCGDELTLEATGFSISPFTTVAWAITPESVGPITTQAEATAANNAGQLLSIANLGESVDYTRICNSLADSTSSGDFYITPFIIENPSIEPFTYDTLQGCKPYIVICPELSAADDNWEIDTMLFIFPDGSVLNVNDAIAFGLPISQQLLDLAGGLPCLNLTDLFDGNPNGQWTISVSNSGTTDLDMLIPDFVAINYADTCNLITQDEVFQITGVSVTAGAGQIVEHTFEIPPVPGGYPNVDDDCVGFGTPTLVKFADCYPELTNGIEISGIPQNSTIVSGNGSIDVTITGGTPPYTTVWDDGPTSVSRANLTAATYTLNVIDAMGLQATDSWVITSTVGIADDLELFGFSLGKSVPNPTNGSTTISFSSRENNNYSFVVRDAFGREVARMPIAAKSGENRIIFEAIQLSAGIYTYSLTNGTSVLTERMVVIK